MAGKILILRWGGSAYESLGGLLDLTARELAGEGFNVVVFAADGQDWPTRLVEVLRGGDFIAALTMSGIGAELRINDGQLFWDAVKVPLFNWCCDHPCYFPVRHAIRSRYVLHGYVFPDHAHYNIQHLNPNGAAFGVHIGIPPRSTFATGPLPVSQRNGRLVFTKSGQDTNAIEARWRSHPEILRQILFDGTEALLHHNTSAFVPVLQPIAERQGLLLHGNSELMLLLIRELDAYVRFRRGNLLMEALLDYPVDVFGTGWDHFAGAGRRAVFHRPVGWQTAIQEMPRYLGCLSINPLVDLSVHDRVFFALAAGVPPLSDSNGFSRANMPELEQYAFDFGRDRICAAVEAVIADPEAAVARTEATYQSMQQAFSMRHAAQQIVQFAALHGLNARCAV